MRVLLDENLPQRLAGLFDSKMQATTVGRRGWSGKKNGELLKMAGEEFDAFVTTDKGIQHQQNLSGIELVIVVLRAKSNDYADLAPLMDEVNVILESAGPETLVQVPSRE